MEVSIAKNADIELLIQLRIDFLENEYGIFPKEEKAHFRTQLYSYFKKYLADETFIAILVQDEDGTIASTAFMAVQEKPASPSFMNGLGGTITNVYTYPRYRKQGCATIAVSRLIDIAKQRGLDAIDLFATKEGLEVYQKLNFEDVTFAPMRFQL